ncbi:MAG: TonB-dependent receptor [Chitinophagaceae bacterium]
MKRIFSLLTVLLLTFSVFSQMPGARQGRPGGIGGQSMNIGHFYGKVVDKKTSKGIPAASVQLFQSKMDTVSKSRKDVIINGMLTKSNGDFSLEGLPVMGNFYLMITAIGFKPFEQKVAFEMKRGPRGGMEQMMAGVDRDLGNIKMDADAEVLEGVTVSGTRPLVQMGIDRKVFNVEKNISSAGGTAVDVMRNVPSVQVDIDGGVTLRNNAPQIYVDGRPTTLTLEQIPADAIQSVEIITNPSSKFDASGGTSGILNIVLKKNRKTGYSGNLRAGIDSRAKVNLGGDINAREGKINLFANMNYNQRKSISTGETERLTLFNTPNTILYQTDKNINLGSFAFGRIGMDYLIDNRNTLTVNANAVRGEFKPESMSDIGVDTLPGSSSSSKRLSNTNGGFRNFGTALSFKHNFAKAGKEITADVNVNGSRNTNKNYVNTDIYNKVGGPLSRRFAQELDGEGSNNSFTAQTDYTNPLGEKSKMELGARVNIRNIDSRNDISYITALGKQIVPQLSSKYKNTDKVYAGYATFSNVIKKFGYQLGLRVESSEYEGTVNTTDSSFKASVISYSNSFPISLFPSVFLTQQLSDDQELQLNYSRRINRPNFFQLFPFTDYSDSLNLSRGNPALTPEFTNSLELSYQKLFEGNHSFLASVYYKNTNNLITRFQAKELNPVSGREVLINTYINANSSYISGLELTSRNPLNKWWELTSNVNLFTSDIKINDPSIVDQDNVFSYFVKLNNSFKLPKSITVQLSAEYQSKTILPPGGSGGGGGGGRGGGGGGMWGQTQSTSQGYIRPNYGVDLAIRYEFLKSKTASVSLSMNDVFRTRRSDIHSESPFFIQDSFRRRDAQVLRLNFSYRFGKFDVSLLKRKNNKNQDMPDVQMQ